MVVDWLNRRAGSFDAVRPALASALTPTLAATLGIVAVLTSSTVVTIALLIAYTLFQNAHNGSANALLATLAGPHRRGFAAGLLQVGTNFAGYGIGPYLVGTISQHLPVGNSLGVGLAVALLCNFWGSLHFLLAARRIAAEKA
jgi:MFS family permease